ncbi:hypothetical protein HZH68_013704 [Vespula germanica]|uniref:Uncharacterized protein n=1 Tax=Vespula germanica TaxID=30212 RepID=A0A834JDU5_VESGE|nr:hypothetical protein HZH68_013704 [Vespula germanica]
MELAKKCQLSRGVPWDGCGEGDGKVGGGGGGGGGGGVGGCETVVDGPPETPWWGEVGAPLTPVLAGAVKGGNVYMPRQSAP